MKFISLFSGVGGFDLALTRLGHECVYANDFDKYCKITYDKNFSHKLDCRSITEVSTEEIPDHDLLVGGFPCQSFSIAGKRHGFEDTRGTMFFEIARILRAKQPRLFILENVKGLLSHDSGRTFAVIIATLTELGYDLQWQVLNSKNFGVPQNRERVFIVGHLRGTRRPKVFPITESSEPPEFATCLDANYWKGADKHGQRTLIEVTQNESDASRVYDPSGIAKTLKGLGGGLGAKTGLYMLTETRTEEAKKIRSEMMKQGKDWSPRRGKELVPRNDDKANTITAGQSKEQFLTDGISIRRLTPVECERLQGFPDNWTAGISDTQRYKQMGNAVTVNVVYEIAKKLI